VRFSEAFLILFQISQEIIEEITVYRIRLRRLIDDNGSLADKDTLPPEDRDTLVKDTKDLEKRLDDLDEKSKNEESRYYFYTESS
jgi:hypothetical protein